MEPLMKMYMFQHWLEDTNEQVELFKHHGYLIGSFTNPEAVKQMLGGNTYTASDEDFDEVSKKVAEAIKNQGETEKKIESNRKRRRKRAK